MNNDWTAKLEQLQERNKALEAVNAELLAALKDAKSVIGSINSGRYSRIVTDDGEVMYTQAEEWVTWARDEVLPLVVNAITAAEALK